MPDRLTEIRARLNAGASDADHWRITEDTDYSYRRAVVMTSPDCVEPDEPFDDYIASGIRDDETADLIAHAPADIAWLLDEVEAWRSRAERQNPLVEIRGEDGSVWVRVDGLKAPQIGGAA